MSGELSPIDQAKFVAAKKAVEYVEDGMRVGLGTGSTRLVYTSSPKTLKCVF